MEKILVAVDFSDSATVVLDYATSFATAFKCNVHILHVETPATAYIGSEMLIPEVPVENEEETRLLTDDLSAMAKHLHQQGINATFELVKGLIAESIVENAVNYKADLIILGTHSHGFLYRAFIGNVSTDVLKHSPCPVLVIPAR